MSNAWERAGVAPRRTLAEAELEKATAEAFGRPPAAWATRLLEGHMSSDRGRRAPTEADFRDTGLSELDARIAMRGFTSGEYPTFQEAATSRLTFGRAPGGGCYSYHVSDKIAQVGRRFAPPATRLEERRSAQARIIESATARSAGEGLLEVCLIDAGEGSCGVYPATTLSEAAKSNVFHAGLHCYLDHPTGTEAFARPERSVRDLAGCLASDAAFRENGLWAKVRVFSSHRDFIAERASTIGMSIRADGEISERATSSTGKRTITRLTKAYSVDFVTAAGRGGRIVT